MLSASTSSLHSSFKQCHQPGLRSNQRLELAGRTGQGSMESLMIREAEVEAFISLLPARCPQLKRGR